MSDRYTRHLLETVYGVRSARKAKVGRDRGAWMVTVFTLDQRQREADIARRFDGLGRVVSCTALHAADRAERKFLVVLVARPRGPAPRALRRARSAGRLLPREPVIPATVVRDLDLAPRAGASDKAPFAHAGQGASYLERWQEKERPSMKKDAHLSHFVMNASENSGRGPHPVEDAQLRTKGRNAPSRANGLLRKPQRRELSLPVAALAYTWAAVMRRGR